MRLRRRRSDDGKATAEVCRIARLALALAAASLAAALLGLVARGAISGQVIVASDTTAGKAVVMSALDGSGLAFVTCAGDLTHGGAPRYFLHSAGGQLFAYDENCAAGTQLTTDTSLVRNVPRWSLSGLRVAYGGERRGTDGSVLERGIFVGDVTLDSSGRPAAITNEHLAIPTASDPSVPSWSGDNHRIVYALIVGGQSDLFVGDVDSGTATNVTSSATNEYAPSFSPVANRIAYVRQTSKGGVYRNDIFVLDLGTRKTMQVTTKANANIVQIGYPDWSPDGSSIAFSGYAASISAPADIYRIPADGSQKAVDLTTASNHSFLVPLWRS